MNDHINNPIINVTQPFLPPIDEFLPYLNEIWQRKWLTNNGFFHQELERALCDYLEVPYISLFSNGTLALITALQTLRISGEVLTTPFSFVATTHALWWNGIKPVFVDIEDKYFNIDPKKIEKSITPKTTAILPVHVYGNPCEVDSIKQIAEVHGLKIIYDACHTFGAKLNDKSLVNFGDISVLSFHATKVFNTFEGGAIICHDRNTKKRIDFLKNFGFEDEITVVAPGINAKMNEIQAAFGLLQLKYVPDLISKRARIAKVYTEQLKSLANLILPNFNPLLSPNYSYFPIRVKSTLGHRRDDLYDWLKARNIFTRRYFYPLISNFGTYRELDSSTRNNLPVANKVADEILCLPIYPDLAFEDVNVICKEIKQFFSCLDDNS